MVKVVLTDKANNIFRVFVIWDKASYYLINNLNTHCVELASSLQEYDELEIPYLLLDQISVAQLSKQPYKLESNLFLRIYKDVPTDHMSTTKDSEMEAETNETMLLAYKWSLSSHIMILSILVLSGWVYKKFFYTIPPLPVNIALMNPSTIQSIVSEVKKNQPEFKQVVKMTNSAINQNANIKWPDQMPRIKNVKSRSGHVFQGSTKGKHPALGNLDSIDKIGGIGSSSSGNKLGTGYGHSPGAFGSGSGSGLGGGLGLGNSGGIKNGLPGKGLVAGLSGEGSVAMAAGGYGNQDFSGGTIGRGGRSVGKRIGTLIVPQFGAADVEGGLAREQVEAVVRKNTGQLRFCYERALQSQPELRGRLTSKWLIGPQGNVQTVKITGSSIKSKDVETCVLETIKAWKFPKPIGGVHVDVDYPFDFNRLSMDLQEGEL